MAISARGGQCARRHRRLSLAAKTLTLAAIVKCRRVENILAKIRDIDTLGCGLIPAPPPGLEFLGDARIDAVQNVRRPRVDRTEAISSLFLSED
jgi:hypothetical protein